MRWTRVAAAAALTFGSLLLGFPAAAVVVTQAQRCAVAKLGAAANAAADVFACAAADARGEGAAGSCIQAVYERLGTAFTKADRRRLCATHDDGELIRATIEEYRARIAAILVQPNPEGKACEAARFDAVAEATANQVECFRMAARHDVVFDFDCLVAERLRLIDVFAALEAGGGCFGGGADQVLGELNFLVGAIGVRLPWTVCGNGIIELGENCDGGPLCDPSCRFTVPACCQMADGCFDATSDPCPPEIGQQIGGEACEANGQCAPQPLAPTELCCQEDERSCSSSIATDTGGLVDAIAACPDAFGGRPIRLGTCNRRGRCRTVSP